MRSARGESLLSETSLFAPQLVVVPPLDEQELARRNTPELPNLLRKLRQTLQAALGEYAGRASKSIEAGLNHSLAVLDERIAALDSQLEGGTEDS
ncbi:response regulator receiver:CheW-like protein:ATP-binding region, ATPase-like:Hpt, partial [Pseudomonas syringae pv. japonica str. M301072]